MSSPQEILLLRFGNVLLQRKEKLEMVSKSQENESGLFVVYQALIDVGASLPSLVAVLSDASFDKRSARVKEIPIKSLHVRTYKNWSDFQDLGFTDLPEELETPDNFKDGAQDFAMTAVSETKDSRTYKFDSDGLGTITLFTSRAVQPGISHGLPFKTKLLGWVGENNFVFVI